MASRIPSGLTIKETLDFVIDAGDWVWIKGERGPLSKEKGEYIFGQRRFALPDVESAHQALDENIPDNLSIYLRKG